MTRNKAIIDLYVYPTFGGMIYVNTDKLVEYKEVIEFNGIEIRTLTRSTKALVTMAHSIYKEIIYTLNDYITVSEWISKKTLKLAEELKCIKALMVSMEINKLVNSRKLILPYRIPLPLWIKILTNEVIEDNITRATTMNLIKSLRDRRAGKQIISKRMRQSY